MNQPAEEFSNTEDVEMRAPLLQSPSTSDADTNTVAAATPATHQELRHRPSAAYSVAIEEGDNDFEDQLLQPQQPRILDRSGMFGQSRGRWGVERRLSSPPLVPEEQERRRRRTTEENRSRCWGCCCFGSILARCCRCLKSYSGCGKDWFFWLAYTKTSVLFVLLFLSYGFIIGFFGFIYLSLSIFGSKAEVNPDGSTNTIAFCDMDINDHMEAMYFSLSTMTTIGYGVSDYYFGGCYSPLLIVLMQTCIAIVFDAVAVGLIFHRISRGKMRSRSILFSDKAVVRNIKGVPHLMFRLGERRKYHLIEATVRCYCIKHERIPNYYTTTDDDGDIDGTMATNLPPTTRTGVRIETTPFVSRQMRLVQPDDRFGSHLWMGLPQVVVHRIDEKSPLMPWIPLWFDARGNAHRYPPGHEAQSNGSTGEAGVRNGVNSSSTPSTGGSHNNLRGIHNFLLDRDFELVVLVEGTDEGTGAATQARHSYKLCDIAWNHKFADCVHPYSRRQRSGPSSLDPVVSIDFAKFHHTVPAPIDCEACAYVPNHVE